MIIDIHTHLFPDAVRATREDFFQGEPAFRLLYDSPKSKLAGVEDTITAMDEDGVDVSVVFGFPWKNPEHSRRCNDYVLEAVAKYPKRLKGFCCVGPGDETAAAEVERCLDAGMSGVGELAFYQSGIDEDALAYLEPIMQLCRNHQAPVMIHTNEPVGHIYPGKTPNTLAQIYAVAKAFPENRIILAHWGGGLFFYTSLKREVRETLKNVYVDTAASPFLYDPKIYSLAAELLGPDKVLFGTDFPLLKAARYYRELESVHLAEGLRREILGGNAARLLKLTPAEPS